nr:hypothetical protein [uncultured Psychroserpens sp.]
MKTLLKGEISFIEDYNNWSVEVFIKWNKRRIQITIKSRNSELKSEFLSCALTKASLLTYISRSDSFNFSGKKSKYSELILESAAAQSLMNSRNASIKLNGKYLIFNGGIKKNDVSSLSNIFKLNEILIQEIDELNKSKRGYGLLEPPLYEPFDNDLDLLISYLELICKELPNVLTDFPKNTKYTVLAVGNPHGPPYPAIGFYCDNPKDFDILPDSYGFEEVVENWLTEDKIKRFKLEAENHKTKSWEELKNAKPE